MIYKRAAEVERFLAAPPATLRAVLIYGRDRSGVQERAVRVAKARGAAPADPFNAVRLNEAEIERDPARLADELSALSLLGGVRLVALHVSGERAGAERIVAEAWKAHLNGDFNPDALMVVEAGALSGGSPLRRAAEASGRDAAVVPVYENDEADMARLVRDALAQDGVRLTPEALTLFVARLPKDRGVARSEIERLALYVGPGARATIGPDQLAPFLGVEADASLSEAAEHAFGARLGPALEHLRRAFSEGEAGVSAVRAAGVHLQRLRRIGAQTRSGVALPQALKSSGVFWKTEREVTRQVRTWPDAELLSLQARVLEVDAQCKSTGSPDLLLAERLYLTVAAQARRAGL